MTLGERAKILGACRRDLGFTLHEVIEALERLDWKTTHSQLSLLERGLRSPNEPMMERWADAVAALIVQRQSDVHSSAKMFYETFGKEPADV